VKLKKLHKMGDVVNTILKHFEKEKMKIDQKRSICVAFYQTDLYCFQIIQIIKSKLSKNLNNSKTISNWDIFIRYNYSKNLLIQGCGKNRLSRID
jgi:hypothetical protein